MRGRAGFALAADWWYKTQLNAIVTCEEMEIWAPYVAMIYKELVLSTLVTLGLSKWGVRKWGKRKSTTFLLLI